MADLVGLSRRFRDLTGADLDEMEALASFGHGGLLRADGWAGVLRHRRAVLLAEAGSGETRAKAARLRAGGKFAFFAELDDLDRDGPTVSLQTPATPWPTSCSDASWMKRGGAGRGGAATGIAPLQR